MNTLFSLFPFLLVAVKGICEKGFSTFIKNIPDKYEELLLSLTWFFLILLFHLLRSPLLLKQDSDRRLIDLEKTILTLKEKRQPRLSLEFKNTSPFIQKSYGYILLRVCVHNLSEVEALRNVAIQVESIGPDQFKFLPIVLHQMHDNPVDGMFKQSFDLPPSGNKYIDVMNAVKQNQTYKFYIEHAARNVPKELITSIDTITLNVYADNSQPVKQTFSVTVNGDDIMLGAA